MNQNDKFHGGSPELNDDALDSVVGVRSTSWNFSMQYAQNIPVASAAGTILGLTVVLRATIMVTARTANPQRGCLPY